MLKSLEKREWICKAFSLNDETAAFNIEFNNYRLFRWLSLAWTVLVFWSSLSRPTEQRNGRKKDSSEKDFLELELHDWQARWHGSMLHT